MIGNNNTKKLHSDECRAIGMMLEEHKEYHLSDEELEGYSECGWCHEPVEKLSESLFDSIGEEVCTDPQLRKQFLDMGCPCGCHIGDVRMHPHDNGIPVSGRDGLWWVYLVCFDCGHTTSQDRLPQTFIHRSCPELLNGVI